MYRRQTCRERSYTLVILTFSNEHYTKSLVCKIFSVELLSRAHACVFINNIASWTLWGTLIQDIITVPTHLASHCVLAFSWVTGCSVNRLPVVCHTGLMGIVTPRFSSEFPSRRGEEMELWREALCSSILFIFYWSHHLRWANTLELTLLIPISPPLILFAQFNP